MPRYNDADRRAPTPADTTGDDAGRGLERFRSYLAQFRGRTVGEQAAWLRQILARNLANALRDLGGLE